MHPTRKLIRNFDVSKAFNASQAEGSGDCKRDSCGEEQPSLPQEMSGYTPDVHAAKPKSEKTPIACSDYPRTEPCTDTCEIRIQTSSGPA